jgi:hypothetical protein
MSAQQLASADPAPVRAALPAATQADFGNPATRPAELVISEPVRIADENWQVRLSLPGTSNDFEVRFDCEDAARQWSADELSVCLQALAEQAKKSLRLRRADLSRTGGDGQHDDFDVFDGDRAVGCIYLVDPQSGTESWFWGVSLQLTGRNSHGRAGSLEEAKAAFRTEYESWKGTQTGVSG